MIGSMSKSTWPVRNVVGVGWLSAWNVMPVVL